MSVADPSHRLGWQDLPSAVRGQVEAMLGSAVVRSRTAVGGFSSSSAEIVTSEAGSSLFVKAIARRINPDSDDLNRREAAVLAVLPPSVPAPALRGTLTWEDWFVLVIEAVEDAATPRLPWAGDQIDATLRALEELQEAATPAPMDDLPSMVDILGPDMRGFDRVAEDPPEDLDPWIGDRLAQLREAAERGIDALEGQTLCHADLRADNLLATAQGEVLIVDWAWACRGSRVADSLQLLSSVEDPDGALGLSGRIDAVARRHGVEPSTATDVLSGILAFFVDASRLPTDSSLPTLPAHRRRRRDALLGLVRPRWESEGRP